MKLSNHIQNFICKISRSQILPSNSLARTSRWLHNHFKKLATHMVYLADIIQFYVCNHMCLYTTRKKMLLKFVLTINPRLLPTQYCTKYCFKQHSGAFKQANKLYITCCIILQCQHWLVLIFTTKLKNLCVFCCFYESFTSVKGFRNSLLFFNICIQKLTRISTASNRL